MIYLFSLLCISLYFPSYFYNQKLCMRFRCFEIICGDLHCIKIFDSILSHNLLSNS